MKKVLLFILTLTFFINVSAQRSNTIFGQSRVQYENFKWKKFETENFEIYYYQKGGKLAQSVAKYAEKDYGRITSLLGYYSYKKIQLVVYNSISDRAQSNIDLSDEKYETGTETKYVKNKIELAFNSTQAALKTEVSFQIAKVLLNEMLYGNGMSHLIQSSYFIELPEWFTIGLSNYVARGWSVEMDNYMRVGKAPSNMGGVNNLRGESAKYVGQSIWNYIVEKYGAEALQNIITFTRLSRDERLSITNTLDLSYKDFYDQYQKFYDNNTSEILANLTDISELTVTERNRYNEGYYSSISLSPNGEQLAFATNEDGKIKIYLKDLETGKVKKLFKQGIKNKNLIEGEKLPSLAWRNNKDLYVVYRGENEWGFLKDDQLIQISGNSLILRNLTGKGRRKYLKKYEQIQSLSFSIDGSQMLMSVVDNGQSDILLYMPKINKTLELTSDLYDDLDPVFLSDGKVVFSSNRALEDEGFDKGSLSKINNNFDVFLLDVYADTNRIKPISNSASSEIKPVTVNEKEVFYIGNKSGINSLYKYSTDTEKTILVKQYKQNINNINIIGSSLTLTAFEERGSTIYFEKNVDFTNEIDVQKTERQKIIERRSYQHSVLNDTSSILPKTKSKKTKSIPYALGFSLNKMHSGVRIDPLLGFGTIFDVTMTDMMENHKISAGIFALADFASNNLYLNYAYIKKRLDFGAKYERENYHFLNEVNFLKFSSQKMKSSVTLPFNYANKLTLKAGWVQTRATFLDLTSIRREDLVTDFADVELAYVLDNTTKEGLNMLNGTRMKISADNMWGIRTSDSTLGKASEESFLNLNFDLRNYTEIFKLFTWANRVSFGSSLGNAPKSYIFGGMDNWFGPKTDLNETPPINYTADVLYLNYVTNVRGFNYNVRNGNNFILVNSELRLPYKKLTSFSTYKSNMVENLQFVFFTDLGTSWSGINPTSQENSINKTIYGADGDAYRITAYNYRSPLVLGFGGGARTVLLGTYVKFDIAWGVEDFKVRGPKGYISIGYDF